MKYHYNHIVNILIFKIIFQNKFSLSYSSPLGPSLDLVSLTEPSISHEKDLEKQNILHIAQLSLFILYGIHTKDDMWLPYFKLLMKKER